MSEKKTKMKKEVNLDDLKIKKSKSTAKNPKSATKKLTKNQKEYKKQVTRLKRNLTRLKNQGAYTKDIKQLLNDYGMTESKKRVSKKDIETLKNIKLSDIKKESYQVINDSTGEVKSVYAVETEKKTEKEKIKKSAELIINNFKSMLPNNSTILNVLNNFINEKGKIKTALTLQALAISSQLLLFYINYPDEFEKEMQDNVRERGIEGNGFAKMDNTIKSLGGSQQDVENALNEIIGG